MSIRKKVGCDQPRVRLIGLRIDGSAVTTSAAATGLVAGGKECTIAKGSDSTSNEVTVTFNKAFARAPVIVATPVTTNTHVEVKSRTTTGCVLETFQVADGTTGVDDADMDVLIMGFDSASEYEA